MKPVCSVEQYYSLIAERKESLGRLKTNCTLTPEAIARYIDIQRFLYEESEGGIFFFSDEETYYQTYYYLRDDIAFSFSGKEKPVLLQNIYKEGKENKFLSFLQYQLLQNHFILKDTLRHAILPDSDELLCRLEKAIKGITQVFQKKGFVYQNVMYNQLEELKEFISGIEQIPYYQIPFYTDEEYMEEADAGRLSCIVDENQKIVAARHLIVSGKKAYGWVGIEEEYKTIYGFAPYILYKQLLYLKENDITMCSWVKTTNIPSIQYHNRIGSEWTGQLEDEWILDRVL